MPLAEKSTPGPKVCPECKRPEPLHAAGCPTIKADPEALKPTTVVEPDEPTPPRVSVAGA